MEAKKVSRSIRNVSVVKDTISKVIEELYQNSLINCEKRVEDGKVIVQLSVNNTITKIEIQEML